MEILTKDIIKQAYEKTGLKPITVDILSIRCNLENNECINCGCPIGVLWCSEHGVPEKYLSSIQVEEIYTWFEKKYGHYRSFWLGFDGHQYDSGDSRAIRYLYDLGVEVRKELLFPI